jgi:DNA-binding transcriptional MerR regulator/methylmalonyl-CoA mutase cobalamin-binding subunit
LSRFIVVKLNKMKYSISDLEQLTGVSTHNIRIWERRYHALEPMRSPGNTRFYDDKQLKKLLDIVSLSQSGLKISRICSLTEEEIASFLNKEQDQTISENHNFEFYISRLLNSGLAYNEPAFDGLLSESITKYGVRQTYTEVIYPMLVRLGLMWRREHICPGQEHFISSIIRHKIISVTNSLAAVNSSAPAWLLFMPEDEEHDIGLLFANYLIRSFGHRVIYLGTKVPLQSLHHAAVNNDIRHFLLFMVRSRPIDEATAYLKNLGELYPDKKIFVAGSLKASDVELSKNVTLFSSVSDFEKIIQPHHNAN